MNDTPEVYLEKLYQLCLHESDACLLNDLFQTVEERFASADLDFVDGLLAGFDPTRACVNTVCVGLVRVTYRARGHLPSWQSCVERVRDNLNLQGLNANHIMRGLL